MIVTHIGRGTRSIPGYVSLTLQLGRFNVLLEPGSRDVPSPAFAHFAPFVTTSRAVSGSMICRVPLVSGVTVTGVFNVIHSFPSSRMGVIWPYEEVVIPCHPRLQMGCLELTPVHPVGSPSPPPHAGAKPCGAVPESCISAAQPVMTMDPLKTMRVDQTRRARRISEHRRVCEKNSTV